MTFFYDLNKRLDGIRATPETTHGQLNERDMGKHNNATTGFKALAKKAGAEYGSKAAGERVAGAQFQKMKKAGQLEEADMEESAFQAAIGKKKYGDEGMQALQKAGREHASDKTMDNIRNKYDKYDEGVYQGGPDKSQIPAVQRPNDPMTMKDLEKERTQSPTSAEGMRALQDKLKNIHPMDEVGDTPAGLAAVRKVGQRADRGIQDAGTGYSGSELANPDKTYAARDRAGAIEKRERDRANEKNPARIFGGSKHGERAFSEEGGVPMTPKQKSFAALAPPADKITFADKIAGAKKEVDEMLGDVAAKAMRSAIAGNEMEEGNDFTKTRLDAIRAGKPSFKVGGKSYRVSGDTSDERAMDEEKEDLNPFTNYKKPRADQPKRGDVEHGSKHDIKHDTTDPRYSGRIVTRRSDAQGISVGSETDDEGNKKEKRTGAGRPKGPAKKPERTTAKAYKHKGKRKMSEEEINEAISALEECGYTVSMLENDAPAEMDPRAIARFNEPTRKYYTKNPHFTRGAEVKSVGKTVDASGKPVTALATKVTPKNKPDPIVKKSATSFKEEELDEKAVSKKQQKFMGMVHAAQKGEKPASKEVGKAAKTMKKSDAEDFAATKHKGLPEKKAKKNEEAVEENTVSGAVATSPAGGGSKSKGGMQFGKGVYEGAIAESFNAKLDSMLAEGMNMNMSTDSEGHNSLSVTATDEDATSLAQILKMAGLGGNSDGYKEACPSCGQSPCGCDHIEEDQDLANSADNTVYADTDYMVNGLSGGLDGQKTTGQTTIPVIASQNRQTSNFREFNGQVAEATESRLWNLFKKY